MPAKPLVDNVLTEPRPFRDDKCVEVADRCDHQAAFRPLYLDVVSLASIRGWSAGDDRRVNSENAF